MSVVHLATRNGALCGRPIFTHNGTPALNEVTCKVCPRHLAETKRHEDNEAFERRYYARAAADCESLGMGEVWSLVANPENASDGVLRGVLAAVARGLIEKREEQGLSVIGGAA